MRLLAGSGTRPVFAQPYSEEFYAQGQEGSKRSAQEIVPLVVELFHPTSVIDLGCGVGAWLAVFQQYGITDVLGVDGGHIDRKMLQIRAEQFLAADLRVPLRLDRRFDLAVCLEVAEHLPPECAPVLVESLVALAPVVVFSAAIPFQSGTDHQNEQWPAYWANRFSHLGYIAIDCLRRRIWRNEFVEWWYAQNLLCFVNRETLKQHPGQKGEPAEPVLALVHPKNYLDKAQAGDLSDMTVWQVVSHLPGILRRALKKRVWRAARAEVSNPRPVVREDPPPGPGGP